METALGELDGGEALELFEGVASVDEADVAGIRAYLERLRRRAATVVVDAFEDLAVGDAGQREEAVVALHEIVGHADPLEVVAAVDRRLALVVVAGPQPPLDLTAHALHGCGRDDAFGCA